MCMKHLFLSFLSLGFLCLAAVAVLGGVAIHHYLSPSSLPEQKLVLIERGKGVSAIAQKLEEEGVITQPVLFKVATRFSESLKAGEYQFPSRVSMAEVVYMMEEGNVFDRKITIPEGLTSYQIVKLLNAREDLKGDVKDVPKEGSLLPDTYHFVKGESAQDKINQMQMAMIEAVAGVCILPELYPSNISLWYGEECLTPKGDNALPAPLKTIGDLLTLASIVEKETGVADERERVAGVFINRLRKGIALQTDPTVIYAITKGKMKDEGKGPLGRRLLRKDLEINSPYNTYKNAGLPPGPIANPGYASIKATLNPEKHDYIFFVADGTGGHAFGKTLAEHNRNVAKWRKIRN